MRKNGQFEVLQLSFLFEVLIAVAIAAILVYSAVSFDVFSKFKREYADADLTLLMDQVVAAPGPVIIAYPLSTKFKVVINGGAVDVKSDPTVISFKESSLVIFKGSSGALDVRRVG